MNWQGCRLDPTGFYDMGARFYDPEGRKFLSPDPLGHASSMDLYNYANGDPINHIDPDGRLARMIGEPLPPYSNSVAPPQPRSVMFRNSLA